MSKKLGPIAIIVQDGGDTVTRVVLPDGTIGKGKARCHDGDEFRPEIGAIISICRAFGKNPAKTCYDVMDMFARDAAAGEGKKPPVVAPKVKRIIKLDGMPAGKVKAGRVVLKATDKLMNQGVENYGILGEETPFVDQDNVHLRVGDLVIVSKLEGDVRTGRKWKEFPGLHFVMNERSEDPISAGPYIMGILTACNGKTGKIDGKLRVRRAKTWREVETGEIHDGIKVVWENVEADDNNE